MFDIAQAQAEQLDELVPLFNVCRVSYRMRSDPAAASLLLSARLANGDSVIINARDPSSNECAGFVQLYPAYSSIRMASRWLPSDPYVTERRRGWGVGKALTEGAVERVRLRDACGLELSAEKSNDSAKAHDDKNGVAHR